MKLLKWLKNAFPTALCVIGAGCIGYGVILINLPAGIIMTGILTSFDFSDMIPSA